MSTSLFVGKFLPEKLSSGVRSNNLVELFLVFADILSYLISYSNQTNYYSANIIYETLEN